MALDEKAEVRAAVFGHLAGIVLVPTVKALADRKVFDLFASSTGWVPFEEVVERTRANRGYLKVALRLLAACGWMKQRVENDARSAHYALTEEGLIALRLAPPLCSEVIAFIPKAVYLEDFLFGSSDDPILPSLQALVERVKEGWGIGLATDSPTAKVQQQICTHLNGMLLGPAMVALARGGVLAQLGQGPVIVGNMARSRATLACIFDLLATQGWLIREGSKVKLTSCGLYAAQIATSYGVTVSYLPTLNVVSTLLFGNPRIPRMDDSGVELLVNRGMNVWGSGGAHQTYFKRVDEIIVEIFKRPLEQQPQGICDMGCGDGALLEHLYSVVRDKTDRGRALSQRPLIIVGADFNKVARRIAKQTLRRAEVPHYHVIGGDINRPAQLASDLEELGLDIHDLLHVRSFLDHNRPFLPPANYVRGTRTGRSSSAFARLGEEIACDELEENLVRHLRRWAPYVGRFGLLVLELHTLPPELSAANVDRTPAIAYDGTHGYSDQYLVELPVFLDSAREAGLRADLRYQCKFPPSDLATVSLNFFAAPGSPAA